ncbi:tyrosine-type recombinase/integrase [Zhenpiania hominis]|uniref:Tyrosine-type recombinase/integrase n=1 Tax=Zhenpiania hominis TaxID=2763644 RepID=A0A923NID2_9FIRM|nr:tyrosine-type recombinase/integrase [Zhenpiania hominis]MBC6679591.1 tyrosine-type recombinase/integrase [Zhenpiania hominis]
MKSNVQSQRADTGLSALGILQEIEACPVLAERQKQKLCSFFTSYPHRSAKEITYSDREAYGVYLLQTGVKKKHAEYLHALDQFKLWYQEMQPLTVVEKRLSFTDDRIFLLYHPDTRIAKELFKTADKEELLWDFSQPASESFTDQVFELLNTILMQPMDRKLRRARLLVLKQLYAFGIRYHLSSILHLDLADEKRFELYLNQTPHLQRYRKSALSYFRKTLFLQSDSICWDASVWYLERFHLDSARVNVANPVRQFSFLEIQDPEHRRYGQQYLRYLLGATELSIATIRFHYSVCKSCFRFLEQEAISFTELKDSVLEDFLHAEKTDCAETINRKVIVLSQMFHYLSVRENLSVPFDSALHIRKSQPYHYRGNVTEKRMEEVIDALSDLDTTLRLMVVTLFCTGLRKNEVCVLTGDCLSHDGTDGWIRLYQSKLRKEKRIPIPDGLYQMLKQYIETERRTANDYLFQNAKGDAYNAQTFTNRMRMACGKWNFAQDGYQFRAHAFRHWFATELFEESNLQVVREFLGHDHDDMTKAYIDGIPRQIQEKSHAYFMEHENEFMKD